MKKLLILLILSTGIQVANSQKLVTVVHNGTSSFFTGNSSVNDAIATALSGDTIYIPGGGFSIGTLTINKALTIYGVGHTPDSTLATYRTELNGNIVLVQGASNTKLEGFYINGDITLGTNASDQVVNNLVIRRVNLNTLRLSYNGSDLTTSNNILIEENIIRAEIHAGYASGLLISKNHVAYAFRYASNALFTNNILSGNYCYNGPFSFLNNCLIQNNYLNISYSPCTGNYFISGNSNHFANNVVTQGLTFPDGSNTGTGNIFNVAASTFFVNCPSSSFDYSYDYHLQNPATYIGTDGTQIGIYGTATPAKLGTVPENPHVSTKIIAPQTDTNGDLNINITVGAQEN